MTLGALATMTASFDKPVVGAVRGLALNVVVPSCCVDLADPHTTTAHARHGTLEGRDREHHAALQALHGGARGAIVAAQRAWRAGIEGSFEGVGVAYIEHALSLGEMVSRAARPLLARLSPDGNLVINCQSTRESVMGTSNAGRILSEASCNGLAFTIGHRGLVGAIQAVEVALVLAREQRFRGGVLLCAGDRWIDVYPRMLGSWATLSDGAAAAAFSFADEAQQANLWVLNGRVSPYALTSAATPNTATLREELVTRLSAFVDTVGAGLAGPLAIRSPRVGVTLGDDVEQALGARHRDLVRGTASARPHFGAANAFINLHGALTRTKREQDAPAPAGYLVWDCDPAGLFGAIAVGRSALETEH